MEKPGPFRGRGATDNPANRFERLSYEPDLTDELIQDRISPKTEFLRDSTQTIVTENKSPDIGFRFSVNPYRGCEHGCSYCYARPSHEYLGYSAGLDFESKIFIKEKAPELLRAKLMSSSWKPEIIMMSGITDCYQLIERKLEITRRCVRVMADFRNPLSMITKNALILRDLDIFLELKDSNCICIFISITSLDDDLASAMEPRTSRPWARLRAVERLAKAGIPVGVNVAPVIPGLNDHELPAILKAAAEAGARMAGFTPIRLPLTVEPVFLEWLSQRRPERKEKVLSLIRSLRGGKLNDGNFGSRMRGEGPIAENLRKMFDVYAKRFGLNRERADLSCEHFRRPGDQLSLL